MKEIGMMFQGPLVRAIVELRKQQTRRIAKTEITMGRDSLLAPHRGRKTADVYLLPERAKEAAALSPAQIGDRIYVRETYWAWGRWETRYSGAKGRDEWHFVDMTAECGQPYLYAADGISQGRVKRNGGVTPTYWRRPALLMPKVAARVWLEVTGVRVEPLQSISKADAVRDGGLHQLPATGRYVINQGDQYFGGATHDPRELFQEIWESTGGDWAANPWVWVTDFKLLSSTGKPQA